MLLSGGALEIKDIDGNVVSGVSGNYYYLFSATFTTYGQVINLPPQAVGKKAFMVVKTTCTTGLSSVIFRNGAALNQTWWGMRPAMNHSKGRVVQYQYDIDALPSTMKYEQYTEFIDYEGIGGWYSGSDAEYKIEIKIYY